MNVGWGSKETQFHGRAGKAAAKVTATQLSPLEPDDDKVCVETFNLSHVSHIFIQFKLNY